MFDSFSYRQHNCKPNVSMTIVEQRATTDASIALLAEMEEKIEKKIVQSMVLSDGTMQASVVVFQNIATLQYDIAIDLRLNGRDYYVKTSVDKMDVYKCKGNPHDFNRVVVNKIRDIIADAIVKDLEKNLIQALIYENEA